MRLFAVTLLLGSLMACGGGGGGGVQDAATSDTPAEDADASEPVDALEEAEAAEEDVAPAAPLVFTVISDPHLFGPLDSPWSERVADLLDAADAAAPAPTLTVVTGDLIDVIAEPPLEAQLEAFAAWRSLMEAHELMLVMGNHDYYSDDSPTYELTEEREARAALYELELGLAPTYAARGYPGVKLITLDSMQGDDWRLSAGLGGSLGQAQLSWLEQELSDGVPALLFVHHPPDMIREPDGQRTLADVLAARPDVVLGIFAGHLHHFARGEWEGIPLYLTGWAHEGLFHHVEVDPGAGHLTILNEDELPYGEVDEAPCDAETATPVDALTAFDGSVQHLLITEASAETGGMGAMLEEAITYVPVLLALGMSAPDDPILPTHLIVGTYVGPAQGSLPPFVDLDDDAPCVAAPLLVTDPCYVTSPVELSFDLVTALGLSVNPAWQARVTLDDVRLEGTLKLAAGKGYMTGKLSLIADLNPTMGDLRGIVVHEYCAGVIGGCAPGEGDMPACPVDADEAFFDQIPTTCDVDVMSFGARQLMAIMAAAPGGRIGLDASFVSRAPELTDKVEAGGASSGIFDLSCM